jgi:leader peptidase (prepilin peptidase)/N-methyltransferase
MNITASVVYGIFGLVIGYIIPDISSKIIEYKKGAGLIKKDSFLYSKWSKLTICIVNTVFWILAGLNAENHILEILVSIMISVGLVIGFTDINIRIIPNELVLTIIVLGIIFQILNGGYKALIPAVFCMIVLMTVFTAVAGFVGFGKVGAGDVKLVGAIGLALGYPMIITAVYIMSIVLLIYIVVGLVFKKISLATMFPLAPFIISGFIVALVNKLI